MRSYSETVSATIAYNSGSATLHRIMENMMNAIALGQDHSWSHFHSRSSCHHPTSKRCWERLYEIFLQTVLAVNTVTVYVSA